MEKRCILLWTLFLLYLVFCSPSSHEASGPPSIAPTTISFSTPTAVTSQNPLITVKEATILYWSRKVLNNQPIPSFLLSKLSPLSIAASTTYISLAATNLSSLSDRLPQLCSAAGLVCLSAHTPGGGIPSLYKNYGADQHNVSNTGTADFVSNNFKKGSDNTTRLVHKRVQVEPGTFFRENCLKKGTVMPMPDIRDKMPKRSFLPRPIAQKIPFSAESVVDIFEIPADTAMGKAVADTVAECEQALSRGEAKRCVCVTSAEDMIDFAVSELGPNVVARTTDNATTGSKGNILVGDKAKGSHGDHHEVTEAVVCHQSLFPYLVYYCHSVPRVRVYHDVEIFLSLETKTKEKKMIHGVAICHADTSAWSAENEAFVELGFAPGKIEVCHWIFNGDLLWAAAP